MTSNTITPDLADDTPTLFRKLKFKCSLLKHRILKRIPTLVWYGQEVDVTITFTTHGLDDNSDTKQAFGQFFSGDLYEIEKKLRELGITFDTGAGFGGRDWEWDWSLKGPVRVKFRSRAKKPELRRRLVKNN